MIAEAAHELGLEGLTLKAVADHLGVSIAALYHHVSGKDDLLRASAEHSTRTIPLPVEHGQNWAEWLLDWATYNHAVFTAQPGLLGQYLEGGIAPESVLRNLDTILGVLVREGFSVNDAMNAYELVTACVLGTVVGATRAAARPTGDRAETYREVLAAAPKRQYTYVRRLASGKNRGWQSSFEKRIETVLRGIADEQGRTWKPRR